LNSLQKPSSSLEKTYSSDERILNRIPREIIFFSCVLALPLLFFFGALTALLCVAGGIFSALSFIWLKNTLSKSLLLGKTKALRSSFLLYGLRILLILAVFFIIIFFFSKKIIAFTAGFSAIIPVFLMEAMIALSRLKKWKH